MTSANQTTTTAAVSNSGCAGFIATGWYTRSRAPSGANFKSGHYPNSNLDFRKSRPRFQRAVDAAINKKYSTRFDSSLGSAIRSLAMAPGI
jgi:hypothetical protein